MAAKKLDECVILHVEDDNASAYLFQFALRQADFNPQLFRVSNSKDARAFLYRHSPYDGAPRPDLVLLDLNLPGENGFSILEKLKGDSELRGISVIVLSASMLPEDEALSMELGADAYLCKGPHFEAFVEAARAACEKVASGRCE